MYIITVNFVVDNVSFIRIRYGKKYKTIRRALQALNQFKSINVDFLANFRIEHYYPNKLY
jgi:hypothetical protein